MAAYSGVLNFSGFKSLVTGAGYPTLSFQNHSRDTYRFPKFHSGTALAPRRNSNLLTLHLHQRCLSTAYISSVGRNYELNYNDGPRTEPFWLNLIRDTIRTTRSLLLFLVEQPSQLKYIEWPSFQSTLKTATLTLVLVALLIVALSSVDSALSYLLALFLRRKA